jgi:hypothetical protein
MNVLISVTGASSPNNSCRAPVTTPKERMLLVALSPNEIYIVNNWLTIAQ